MRKQQHHHTSLFVYGTLKEGNHNHGYLLNSRKIAKGFIKGYHLYTNTGIPLIVPCIGGESALVHGELYSVTDAAMELVNNLERSYRPEKVKVYCETMFNVESKEELAKTTREAITFVWAVLTPPQFSFRNYSGVF